MHIGKVAFLTFFFGLAFSLSAQAQFVGDIFAETPSQSAAKDDIVTVQYNLFAGTEVVGGQHFTLAYDSSELEFVDFIPKLAFSGNGGATFRNDDGLVTVLLANTSSQTDPSGTVALADLSFRVLAESGNRISLNASNLGSRTIDLNDITNQAFNSEIVVTTTTKPSINIASHSLTTIAPGQNSQLMQRLLHLRRPGQIVSIAQSDGSAREYLAQIGE